MQTTFEIFFKPLLLNLSLTKGQEDVIGNWLLSEDSPGIRLIIVLGIPQRQRELKSSVAV